jgi:hypothetical protein
LRPRDGKELFFIPGRQFVVVSITTTPSFAFSNHCRGCLHRVRTANRRTMILRETVAAGDHCCRTDHAERTDCGATHGVELVHRRETADGAGDHITSASCVTVVRDDGSPAHPVKPFKNIPVQAKTPRRGHVAHRGRRRTEVLRYENDSSQALHAALRMRFFTGGQRCASRNWRGGSPAWRWNAREMTDARRLGPVRALPSDGGATRHL